MKIALLNLPFDNNYGGNLQRYALITVLESMGHTAVHIDLEVNHCLKWYIKPYSYTKRIIQKYFLGKDIHIYLESFLNLQNQKRNLLAHEFYEKYIQHTKPITSKKELLGVINDDINAVIVGSDQVWRESMTRQIGIDSYFLSFVNSTQVKKIAYAVSMGSINETFSTKNLPALGTLYSKFDAVSVREESALKVLQQYGWTRPQASLVLDPTLLLESENYQELINKKKITKPSEQKVFCYILDKPTDFNDKINEICNRWHSTYQYQSLGEIISIEEWLSRIFYSKLVVTDSYHGCVFSILFGKPFIFLGNERRGNTRIESLFNVLGIKKNESEKIDYTQVNKRIVCLRSKSITFLKNSLK